MYRVHFNVIISVQRHILSLNLTKFFFFRGHHTLSYRVHCQSIIYTNQLFT